MAPAPSDRPLPDVVWDDGGWQPLPPLAGDTTADVCVVGLGGSGLTAIGALLDRGLDVVGLDAGPVAGGAAGRNGGFLLAGLADFHHVAAETLGRVSAAALYRLTLAEMDRMAAETPAAIRRPGSVRLATSEAEAADCAAQLAAMRADDLPVEPYEGPEGSGLRFPRDGVLQPLRRCRLLARDALERGARLHERSPVVALQGTEVRIPDGVVRCERAIVCVDGRLETLLPELAGRVRTARVQMVATAPTDEVSLPMPVYARYGYDFWQQLPDGRIALGGRRDAGGEDEWTAEGTSPVVQTALEAVLREDLGVTAPITHRWSGAVGFSVGPLPVLAEVRPGVVAAGGYRGTGNVVGAIWGRCAVELAVDGAVADPAVAAALAG
jgi:gamma-glutamylputrescine oxidase